MTSYVFAGGCFWCLDAVYRDFKGVESSICGYSGGKESDADYYSVASGNTGHAEAVQITFDETVIPAETILDIFFSIHDPTTKDRQGADVGPQYRSAMFYADAGQQKEFEAAVERAKSLWNNPIVTELTPLEHFYEAEAEHQDYYKNHPFNGYCSFVISPKVSKARKKFADYLK